MPQGQLLTLDEVDELRKLFFKRQSYSYVSRKSGKSRPTVKRYAEVGDPSRGIVPFIVELRRTVRETRKVELRQTVYSNLEQLRVMQDHVMVLDEILQLYGHKLLTEIAEQKVTLTSWAKALKVRSELVRLGLFDEREVTSTQTSTSGGSEFDEWPLSEVKYYVAHGHRPSPEELREFELEHGLAHSDGKPIDVEAEHQRWGADHDSEDDDADDND